MFKMRNTAKIITITLSAFALTALFKFDHQASNANDGDPRTYSFFTDGKDAQLIDGSAEPIKNTDVKNTDIYNNANGYEIMIDGNTFESLNWTFNVEADGITNTEWADTNFPSIGEIKIDSTKTN